MRDGLLVTENIFKLKNIGDYIQSIAARQFTNDAVYVQREQLNSYSGESVKMIMNGWFMTNPDQFPPSVQIDPLYVSFHMNPSVAPRMLSPAGIAHLKAHEPIGCRDLNTVKMLKAKGIKAYFTGCLTLTLGKTYAQFRSGASGVVFVDPTFIYPLGKWQWLKATHHLIYAILHPIRVRTIAKKLLNNFWFMEATGGSALRRVIVEVIFLKTYLRYFCWALLRNAEFVTHMVEQDKYRTIEDKFELADSLLKKYAHSSLIVTSRIHAALPCLSMGTPVIFVSTANLVDKRKVAGGRLDGISTLFNTLQINGTADDGYKFNFNKSKNGVLDVNSIIENGDEWKKLAQDLDSRCRRFMAD